MQELILENPTLFIGLILFISVALILIQIIASMKGKKKKNERLANEDIVEIAFDDAIFPASKVFVDMGLSGYKIFTVNNQEPCIINSSLLVPSGEAVIDLQRIIYARLTKETNIFKQQKISLHLERGTKYLIEYDVLDQNFSCKAK